MYLFIYLFNIFTLNIQIYLFVLELGGIRNSNGVG